MKIACHIRLIRPHVVVTFDPFGAYGHPDHIALSQYTVGAVTAAADAGFLSPYCDTPHRVSKLYYMADTVNLVEDYRRMFGGADYLRSGRSDARAHRLADLGRECAH